MTRPRRTRSPCHVLMTMLAAMSLCCWPYHHQHSTVVAASSSLPGNDFVMPTTGLLAEPAAASSRSVDDDASVVLENPDFEETIAAPSDGDDGSSDSSDESESEDVADDDEETTATTKTRLAHALRKTRPKHVVRWCRRHKTQLVIVVTIFAFRRELAALLTNLIVRDHSDQMLVGRQRQQQRRIMPPFSLTSVLKLALFVYFGHVNPIVPVLLRLGSSSLTIILLLPLLILLAAAAAAPMHNVHVPLPEQHFTFERVNERYYKDGLALRKASAASGTASDIGRSMIATNPLLAAVVASVLHRNTTAAPVTADRRTENTNTTTAPTSNTPRRISLAQFLRRQLPHYQQSSFTTAMHNNNNSTGTVILLDWTHLDTSVTQMSTLRDQVSFLLHEFRTHGAPAATTTTTTTTTTGLDDDNAMSRSTDEHNNNTTITNATTAMDAAELEVVLLLESPGGSASDYALAASQVLRLRNEPGITVTIAVDKVAASGGYMIACTSSPGHLLAAPFAILGSIGVIGQTLNVQQALEGWGIQPLVFRGGRDKAPIGVIGEISEEGKAKFQSMIDGTHRAFKRHVAEARPMLASSIDDVATGDIFLGHEAFQRGLIDRVVTSDEYIFERMADGARVLKLVLVAKPKYPFQRPSAVVTTELFRPVLSLLNAVASTVKKVDKLLDSCRLPNGQILHTALGALM